MADATTVAVLIKARDEASSVLKRVGDQSQRMADGFKKHRREIGMAAAGIGAAITGAAVMSVKAASDLGESMNAVNVIFGDGAKVIHEFGQTSSRSAGLSTASFNQLASTTGALLKDVGLPMEKVAGLTTDLTVRAADMASVMNTSVEDALSAVGQALRGETEAIRRYAGDVTDASLEQFRLAEGMQKSVKEMTEQEKRLLRVSLIMQQTDTMAGDFANTQNSLANQLRIANAEFENTRAAIGLALLPIMEQFAGVLMPILSRISDWIKQNPELSKWIIIITAGIGALLIPLGALLLILPGLAAGFIMVSASILPITIGLIAVVAAVAAAILIWKNWDRIMEVVKKGLVIVAKGFLEYAKTILKGAKAIADFIPGMDGLAKKIDEGIGKIDDIEHSMDKWAEGTKDAEVSITNSSEKMADSQNEVAKASADKAVVVGDSAVKVETAINNELRAVQTASTKEIEAIDLVAEATKKAQSERFQAILESGKLIHEASKRERERIESDLDALADKYSQTNMRWRTNALDQEKVLEAWAGLTGKTIQDVIKDWQGMRLDFNDTERVVAEFEKATGRDLFKWSEDNARNMKRVQDSAENLRSKFGELQHQIQMSADEDFAEDWESITAPTNIPKPKVPEITSRTTAAGVQPLLGKSDFERLGEFADQTDAAIRKGNVKQGVLGGTKAQVEEKLNRLAETNIKNLGWSREKADQYNESLKMTGFARATSRASGGVAGGLTLVGERGPELVNLPGGSYVHKSGTGPGGGVVNQFHFHGPVYGVESLKETVVEAVRDHALSGGFAGVFAEV